MKLELLKRYVILVFVFLLGNTAFGGDDFIENVSTSGGEGEASITWNIKYEHLPTSKRLVIRYLESNLTKLDANPKWKYSRILKSSITSYTLTDLAVNEKYAIFIGVIEDDKLTEKDIKSAAIEWSKEKFVDTKRSWKFGSGLIMRILMLLGALALFIYGMKVMSEGIQKAAGQRLRQILGAITKNRLKGIFTGFVTTSIIQSSSATTVMVVSFVNAGLLNLKQSIGVIMGANIGTTVTAWIVAFLGFSVSMSDYALPIMLIAILMLFSNRGNIKSWGEMLVGFALLFIGLEMLKNGVPDIKGSVSSLEFLKSLSGHGIFSVMLFVLIGTLVTIIVQSSSAAMAITILLCERGVIPFEMAAGMVLGENIGTTITANLAAIVGNVHAKRAARAHFIFNVFGVTWMVIAFPLFIDLIDYLVSLNFVSPIAHQEARPIALALFHTIFNVLNVLLLVWFTSYIAKIVTWLVPSKTATDEEFHLDYISGGLLATPELFLLEAQKELAKFGKITSKMSKFIQELMFEQDSKKKSKLIARVARYEEITDEVEQEISHYLNKCAVNELSVDSGLKVRSMLAVTSELERIGDVFYQISLTYKRKDEQKIWFTPDQRANVKAMLEGVDAAFDVMIKNLKKPYENVTITEAMEKERKLNKMRDKFRKRHLATIEDGEFNVKSAAIYTDLIYSCERVGDHIINVTEALIGQNIIGEED